MKITKETFKPTGHLVLVKKLGMKYKTVVRQVPMNNGGDMNKEVQVEEVKDKQYYNQQLAEVISLGTDLVNAPYKIGDTVVYDMQQFREFDLLRGTGFINDYSILGTLLE